jgi:GTPase SAR1 family protein
VYDITSRESFEASQEWKKEIENNADRDVLVYLVGNRADLGDTDQREVTQEDGLEMMQTMDLHHHIETSALTGQNIAELFETLTKHLYLENNKKLGEFRDDGAFNTDTNRSSSISFNKNRNVNLYAEAPKKKKKRCC